MKKLFKTIMVAPNKYVGDNNECCEVLNNAYDDGWQFLESLVCGECVLYTLTKFE